MAWRAGTPERARAAALPGLCAQSTDSFVRVAEVGPHARTSTPTRYGHVDPRPSELPSRPPHRRPRRPGGHAPCLCTLATPLSGSWPCQLVSRVRWTSSGSPTHPFPSMADENEQSRSFPVRFCRSPLEPARRGPPQPLSIAV
jgi:hypothetical protein